LSIAPEIRVEPLEKKSRPVIPTPGEVTGQSAESRQTRGQIGESFPSHIQVG